jgi:hypothetical protein
VPQIDPLVTPDGSPLAGPSSEGWAAAFAEVLAGERARVREFLAAYGRRLREAQEGLTAELERIVDEHARPAEPSAAEIEELQRRCQSLQSDRDELAERLAAADQRAADLQDRLSRREKEFAQSSSDGEMAAGLRRRHEAALEEVRELKARNQALEAQVREGRSAAGGRPAAGGGLDWEAQKRRILAALEAESVQEDAQTTSRRLEINKVVATTEQVLRQKDQEVADLRQLLEGQTRSIGSVAVGAAALEEVFNKDPLIEEQRNHLRGLEKEWEDKLRSAELEISLERAKLARQRVEIEEKLRQLNSATNGAVTPDEAETPEKLVRGRWRSWLGLKDGPEQ